MPSTCFKFSLPLKPKEGDMNTHIQVEVDYHSNKHVVMLTLRPVEVKGDFVSFMLLAPTFHLALDTMNRLNRKKVEQCYLLVKREIDGKTGTAWEELNRFLAAQGRELA